MIRQFSRGRRYDCKHILLVRNAHMRHRGRLLDWGAKPVGVRGSDVFAAFKQLLQLRRHFIAVEIHRAAPRSKGRRRSLVIGILGIRFG